MEKEVYTKKIHYSKFEAVRDISSRPILGGGQRGELFTYGPFFSNPKDGKKRIYENYIREYKKRIENISQSSLSPEELIEGFESTFDIGDLIKDNAVLSESTKKINKFYSQKRNFEAVVKKYSSEGERGVSSSEIISALTEIKDSLKEYLDYLSEIPSDFKVDKKNSSSTSINLKDGSKMFSLTGKSATAFKNCQYWEKEIEKVTEQIQNDSAFSSVYFQSPQNKSIRPESLGNSISGSLSHITTAILEYAIAEGLGKANQEIKREVINMGKNSKIIKEKKGGEKKDNKLVAPLGEKTFGFGFGIKNSSKANKKSLSLKTTKLGSLISMLEIEKSFMYNFAYWTYVNKIPEIESAMTLFLASLTASYILNGEEENHFALQNGKVVPLIEFYEEMERKLQLEITGSKKEAISKKDYDRTILNNIGSYSAKYTL